MRRREPEELSFWPPPQRSWGGLPGAAISDGLLCCENFRGALLSRDERMVELRVKVENKMLKYGVTRKAFKLKLLHLAIGAVGTPTILSHAVNGGHHTSSMPS